MAPMSTEEQNRLVAETLDLVGHIVAEVSVRYPRHVDRSELWNAGALGLVEASRRYDPESGIPFARYAAIRIRGAIIDSTRTRDWASRSVRRRLREINQATAMLEEQHGQAPNSEELAEFLGITVEELVRRQAQASVSTLLHLDQPADGDDIPLVDRVQESSAEVLPEVAFEERELRGNLVEAVRNLPPIQAEVISRYYLEGELLQDIADDLGLTEARVSQIRSEALASMRSFFATQYEGVEATPESTPGKRARAAYLERMAATDWRTRIEAAEERGEVAGRNYAAR